MELNFARVRQIVFDALSRWSDEEAEGECVVYALRGSDTRILARFRAEIENQSRLAGIRDRIICGEMAKE